MASNESLRTLVKGSGFSFVGSLFSKFSHYVFYWLIARLSGAEGFGVFSVALAVIGFSQIIALLGLRGGVNRYVAYYRGQDDEERARGTVRIALTTVVASSLVMSVVVLFADQLIVDLFLDPDTPLNVVRLAAMIVPLEALSALLMATLRGLKRIDYQVFSQNILQGILKIVGFGVFFSLGTGLFASFLLAYALAMAGTVLVGMYFVERRSFQVLQGRATYETGELLAFSIPLLFTGALNLVVDWTDILMIGFFGVNSDVGIYNIALQTALVLQLAYTSFSSITGPVLSELVGKGDTDQLESVLKISNKWVLVLTIPMFTFVIPFASDVIRLFGSEFRDGAGVVVLLGAAMILKTTFSLSGNVIKSMGHSKIIMVNHGVAALLNVALNFVLIPRIGILGAAVATGVAIALDGVLPAVELYLWKNVHPVRTDFLEPVVAAGIATGGVYLTLQWVLNIHYLMILPLGVFYLGVYGVVLMLVGGLQEEDVYILRAIKDRTGLESPRVERFVRRFT